MFFAWLSTNNNLFFDFSTPYPSLKTSWKHVLLFFWSINSKENVQPSTKKENSLGIKSLTAWTGYLSGFTSVCGMRIQMFNSMLGTSVFFWGFISQIFACRLMQTLIDLKYNFSFEFYETESINQDQLAHTQKVEREQADWKVPGLNPNLDPMTIFEILRFKMIYYFINSRG